MKICGLQKTTLLDFPGKVAATIFTGASTSRCPFCHNSQLLEHKADIALPEDKVLAFLKKRRNILEGVCITGGEPTLQPDLEEFICKVRSLGLAVKLDTNGYRPEILKMLCQKGRIDAVALDIKAGPSHYERAAGCAGLNLEQIEQSIRFLLNGAIPYEFRTTVVAGLHDITDFQEIGPWIRGCKQYFLQCYKESGQVLDPDSCHSFTRKEMEWFAQIIAPFAEQVTVRGMD